MLIIHKSAGILIQNRKLLVTRSYNETFFTSPGGRIEENESVSQCLIRELNEELGIRVLAEDFKPFGLFTAPAKGEESRLVEIQVFLVNHWDGEIVPSHEIAEICWIASHDSDSIELGSIFAHEVIPRLKNQNLID